VRALGAAMRRVRIFAGALAGAMFPAVISVTIGQAAATAEPHRTFHVSHAAHPHGHGPAVRPPPADVDSLPNFLGTYSAPGFDRTGRPNTRWVYDMVGNPPERGGTTTVNAPIIPVIVNFRDANGGIAHTFDPTDVVQKTVQSPLFANRTYTSSPTPTQFNDAIQRAQFYTTAQRNWHTLLTPSVKTTRTLDVPFGAWEVNDQDIGLINDRVFVSLFYPPTYPVDRTTLVGAAELDGDMTTHDITTFLTKDVFLFVDGDRSFVYGGFHSYDFEPGATSAAKERRYVLDYSTWITAFPGTGFEDIITPSHELSEIINDPFVTSDQVTSVTPWWKSPNGTCRDDMETGDVIDGLPGESTPTLLNGFTYHPENEALLPWFEEKSPSDAIGRAYSYPDTTLLTKPNKPQRPGCV
jgi:hypothetical protein